MTMTIPEILQALEFFSEIFPREALEAAIANQEAIAPVLLDKLENLKGKFQDIPEDYYFHVYSFFLLAQFRETRAYPLIVDLMIEAGEQAHDLFGDFITENLASVLASVYDGNPAPLLRLIETDGDEFVRGAGIQALSILYLYEQLSRQELLNYLKQFVQQCLETPKTFPLATELVMNSINVHATELKEDLKTLFDADLVDWLVGNLQEVESELTRQTQEESLEELRKNSSYQLVDDVIEEMSSWYCFQENKEEYEKARLEVIEKLLTQSIPSRQKEELGFSQAPTSSEETAPKYRMNPQKKAKQKQQKQSRKKNRPKKK